MDPSFSAASSGEDEESQPGEAGKEWADNTYSAHLNFAAVNVMVIVI